MFICHPLSSISPIVAYETKVHCAAAFIANAEETVRILRNLHGMTSSVCLAVHSKHNCGLDVDNTTNLFLRYYFQQMDVVIHYGIMASQHYHITYGDYTNGQQAVFIIVYRRKMIVCWPCFGGVVGGRVAMLM